MKSKLLFVNGRNVFLEDGKKKSLVTVDVDDIADYVRTAYDLDSVIYMQKGSIYEDGAMVPIYVIDVDVYTMSGLTVFNVDNDDVSTLSEGLEELFNFLFD